MRITTKTVLERGVAEILPDKNSLEKLMSKRKIKLYQGFDPSSPSLHIGHMIGIRKLAQFQKLGHKVIFLIGDFTGMIGDPTDKSAARVKLSHKQVVDNAKGYKKQIERLIDFKGKNAAEIKFNSEWLAKLTFEEIIELASNFTVQQMIERNFFQNRINTKKPIYLHEFFYPMMQGYDSVAMDVDLEIGGSDQLFNMLAGRTLMKVIRGKNKFVLTTKLLADPKGKKMSKSEGNTVNLADDAEQIFGAMMALPDGFVEVGYELLTDLDHDKLNLRNAYKSKLALAREVVSQIHGKRKAQQAYSNFKKTFIRGVAEYTMEVELKSTILEIVANEMGSNAEAKRLIKGGAVDVEEKTVTDPKLEIMGGERVKIGKKIFVKVKRT